MGSALFVVDLVMEVVARREEGGGVCGLSVMDLEQGCVSVPDDIAVDVSNRDGISAPRDRRLAVSKYEASCMSLSNG